MKDVKAMSGENFQEQNMSRRSFLKAAMATAVVATAAGAGAAVVVNESGPAQPAVISSAFPPLPPVTHNLAAVSGEPTELLARLAAVQAENVRLRSALDAAERRLSTLAQNSGNDALTETLQLQLGEANNRIHVLAGLVALYEQLDEVDMSAAVNGGLTAVGGILGLLTEKAVTVAQGLVTGREALNEFEAHIPLVENGRFWLMGHVARIAGFYQGIEDALRTVAEKAGSFLQMLNEWFQDVMKWLPFGFGRKAAQIMAAMTTLLNETPNTIAGLRTNVAQPLDVWLGSAGEEMPLRRKLIKPLREQALQPAAEVLEQAEAMRNAYQNQLVQPVETIVTAQQAVRQMITDYRQRNQL
jgi:hypothetical protein